MGKGLQREMERSWEGKAKSCHATRKRNARDRRGKKNERLGRTLHALSRNWKESVLGGNGCTKGRHPEGTCSRGGVSRKMENPMLFWLIRERKEREGRKGSHEARQKNLSAECADSEEEGKLGRVRDGKTKETNLVKKSHVILVHILKAKLPDFRPRIWTRLVGI